MTLKAEPNSSVGSVADLGTGGSWFDQRLGQYSFRGLTIVIATGFVLPSLTHCCPLFRQWSYGKAASGLERILCGVLVEGTQEKLGKVHWLPR